MATPDPESVLGLLDRFESAVAPLLDDGDRVQVLVPATTVRPGSLLDIRNRTPATVKSRRCLLVATEYAWIATEIRMTARDPLFLATGHGRRDLDIVADGQTPVRGLDRDYFVEPDWAPHVRAAGEARTARRAGQPWSPADLGEWASAGPHREQFGNVARRLRIGGRAGCPTSPAGPPGFRLAFSWGCPTGPAPGPESAPCPTSFPLPPPLPHPAATAEALRLARPSSG